MFSRYFSPRYWTRRYFPGGAAPQPATLFLALNASTSATVALGGSTSPLLTFAASWTLVILNASTSAALALPASQSPTIGLDAVLE